MKKSFLIAGLIAGLTATNGYAVGSQTVVVHYTCPPGCELSTSGNVIGSSGTGFEKIYCTCPDGTEPDATVEIINMTPSPATIQKVMSQSTLNQAAMKNAKKVNKVSARSAETPKMVKKIVYEEIVSDDDAE